MITEILGAYDRSMTEEIVKHECKYCRKKFAKESTLASHVCERKRRFQQEKEIGVQWGLRSYLLFYETTQTVGKSKNYDDFVDSPYYLAFVKFGRYCVNLRCINFISFTQWLLKNNKRLDNWCSDRLYEEWLINYLRTESAQDALERGLKEMQSYAEAHPELKNGFNDYFRYGNVNRIVHHISTGRISPWVVYNCATGVEFLSSMTEDQIKLILAWINPEYWNARFEDSQGDVQWARQILSTAGL